MRAIHRINGITVLDVDASVFARRLAGLHSQGVTAAENKRFLLGWSEARARGLYCPCDGSKTLAFRRSL
jgi:hypothetical protein